MGKERREKGEVLLPSASDVLKLPPTSHNLDLKTEDCGARPVAFRKDAPQGGAGQEHLLCAYNLERRGERKEKCFCLLPLTCYCGFWIVELSQCPSDKMPHRTVLVRNTHSAHTTWKGEERERRSTFAFCL